jgi:hypothetical protein
MIINFEVSQYGTAFKEAVEKLGEKAIEAALQEIAPEVRQKIEEEVYQSTALPEIYKRLTHLAVTSGAVQRHLLTLGRDEADKEREHALNPETLQECHNRINTADLYREACEARKFYLEFQVYRKTK